TSIAAFVGWAPKGPTDRAELVLSWPDYERKFGGLDNRSYLGYAVSHFFGNGGQRAYIVRLSAADAAAGSVTLDGKLKVSAASAGEWAKTYAVVTKQRTDEKTRFRLAVVSCKLDDQGKPIAALGTVESFENLSMKDSDPRFVVNVLKNESA